MLVDTKDVALNAHHIKLALRNDPEFFIQFFLGDQLTEEIPGFHIEVFNSMINPTLPRLGIAIPRAHAKTTLCKLAVVWYLLFSEYRFVLYVSGSHDLVVPYVNDIAGFFETENFISVFGAVKWLKRSDGEGIYKFILPGLGNKTCILRGLGSGQRTRGVNVDNTRPELAICDDLEDDDDVATESQHKKMLNWWVGPFLKCLNKFRNKIIMSGNLLSTNSVFYKMLTSPQWHTYIYGVLKADGSPLWPAMWPMQDIINDYLEYMRLGKISRWFAEMMNHPVPEGGLLIDVDKICYQPPRDPQELEYGFITIDPALSSNDWGDNCGICAHGFVEREQQWQVLQTHLDRGMTPTQIFWKAIEMADYYGFRLIGCEAGAMQGALQHTFELLLFMNGLTEKYSFVPVSHGNKHKSARIYAWASMLVPEAGRPAIYALTFGEFALTSQLHNYDPAKKENDDDGIDAAAQGVQMKDQYMAEIMTKMPHKASHNPSTLYDIAAC